MKMKNLKGLQMSNMYYIFRIEVTQTVAGIVLISGLRHSLLFRTKCLQFSSFYCVSPVWVKACRKWIICSVIYSWSYLAKLGKLNRLSKTFSLERNLSEIIYLGMLNDVQFWELFFSRFLEMFGINFEETFFIVFWH